MRADDVLAAEPGLRRLQAPTLIVWGAADPFFPRKWAYWLASVIPGVTDVLELAEAKLFFPDERRTNSPSPSASSRNQRDRHCRCPVAISVAPGTLLA
jgi:hypothetical protein